MRKYLKFNFILKHKPGVEKCVDFGRRGLSSVKSNILFEFTLHSVVPRVEYSLFTLKRNKNSQTKSR